MKSRSEVTPAGLIKVAIVSALAVIIPMIIAGIISNILATMLHQETNTANEKEPRVAIVNPLEKVNNPKIKDY